MYSKRSDIQDTQRKPIVSKPISLIKRIISVSGTGYNGILNKKPPSTKPWTMYSTRNNPPSCILELNKTEFDEKILRISILVERDCFPRFWYLSFSQNPKTGFKRVKIEKLKDPHLEFEWKSLSIETKHVKQYMQMTFIGATPTIRILRLHFELLPER